MTRSSRRKALVVVLGLGLAALAVDRLFLGGQTDAVRAAAATAGPVFTVVPPGPVVASGGATITDGASLEDAPLNVVLARRFERTATALGTDSLHVPDAFEPAMSWRGEVETPSHDAPSYIPPSEFMRRYELQAIMVADGRDCAIVSGQLLHLGEVLDGWRLVEIGERTISFVAGEDRVALVLDREDGTPAPRR